MNLGVENDIRIESRILQILDFLKDLNYVDDENSFETIVKTTIPFFQKSLKNIIKKHANSTKYDFIDLFAGAGGLSLGLEEAGFNPIKAVDNYKAANQTYLFNRPFLQEKHIVSADIKTVETELFEHAPLIVGGPPCQGFSNANKQKKEKDDRNQLYKFFVKSVENIQPQIFLMENVEGILPFKERIKEDFKKINYTVRVFRINTHDLGLPQRRKRVFFLGINNNLKKLHEELFGLFTFDEFIQKEFTLKAAIGDLPPLEAKTTRNATRIESSKWGYTIGPKHINKSKYSQLINGKPNLCSPLLNHKAKYNNERDIQIYSILKQGEKSDAISIQHLNPYKNRDNIFKDKFFKLKYNKPSKTVTAHMYYDCHMYIHPTQARGLTPREAARIQGFPDNYLFLGSPNEWYRQIGNAVSPILARFIGEKLSIILDKIFSN
jgi:DNA (cytosine-5)-methyltransferase 1